MLSTEQINKLIGVEESYQVSFLMTPSRKSRDFSQWWLTLDEILYDRANSILIEP